MYSVQCTVYTVHCTLYTVHCTLYSYPATAPLLTDLVGIYQGFGKLVGRITLDCFVKLKLTKILDDIS